MKKFFVTILAFLYLSTSIGATIHMHYCMGKLVSWGLVNHESGNCEYCGMQKNIPEKGGLSSKNHCCKDEHKEIKSGKDQKLPQPEFRYAKTIDEATTGFVSLTPAFHISSVCSLIPAAHAPPEPGKQPVFLLNRNFRI